MDDARIERALTYDFSAGSEEFQEDLLERCLSVLAAGGDDAAGNALPQPLDYRAIDDADLDMLAAAGDVYSQHNDTLPD